MCQSPVAERLTEYLGKEVKLAEDETVVGDNARAMADALEDGDVMLLENVRFRKEETKNEPGFSRALASLADVFVNDAFGTAHRAHCSTTGVAEFLPAVCGYLIQKEISFMGGALANPKRPLVAILGGAKVADKLKVISNLLEKCDTLIIGGGMTKSADKFLAGVIEQYKSMSHTAIHDTPFVLSELDEPGIIGAAMLPKSHGC